MLMRKGPRTIVLVVIAVMGVWTVIQLIGALRSDNTSEDAKILLYEASLFQVELLSGFAGEANRLAATDQLNGLKQAAYSVEYTHGKLLKAWGAPLPELRSVSRLMEWIVRMQIGGDRALKAEETELLGAVGPHFQQLHAAYAQLLTQSGHIVGSQADMMKKADDAIVKLLSEHVK
ncbi:hypothetical protein [Paenibacillus alkalitolerans]|uniref:hypothetical protein n=1 Tax=Paenibacillus alkalitolerans TaxID=2799335 RepID=UPI0018F30906|nr:hypothetical protein [Paenibacillus alkalitolerans]